MTSDQKHPYADLLDVPRPTRHIHPPMPLGDRAAQFAPFAALTGHYAAILETARVTQSRMQLTEDEKEQLDYKQQLLHAHVAQNPAVTVTYFVPDAKKDGGEYRVLSGHLRGINRYRRIFCLMDGTEIPLDDIVELSSPLYQEQ
ncbi:hypothetical protein [Pseudoflavonifractor sp. An85]|uniref:hypothetical protein n=1 Tax=Pseudoflavonifractor sp. An85 TaxID=1965661 RepID=UPI000B38A500|nr:hypothetical protein [Pseudoflavonifractor sp. An85]OUN25244.1 hypothetical protein B5G37_04820 [Pseudoflavonifractor sp. An85]